MVKKATDAYLAGRRSVSNPNRMARIKQKANTKE
jgi:hypothetical protein